MRLPCAHVFTVEYMVRAKVDDHPAQYVRIIASAGARGMMDTSS